jgi:hypothetical protein
MVMTSGCQWASFRYDAGLTGYNPTESAISGATGSSLVSRFTVDQGFSSTVIVASGMIVGKRAGGTLWAADDAGVVGCAGSPKVCQPVWTAPTNIAAEWISSFGNNVLVQYETAPNETHRIAGFDTAGQVNCSGTPKVCAPVWITDDHHLNGGTVFEGLLYTADGFGWRVYDAAGQWNCTAGTPRVCKPLWTGPASFSAGSPAIAGGRVYVAYEHGYAVFDAAGTQNCAGGPKVCLPLWVANLGSTATMMSATPDYVMTVRPGLWGTGAQLEVSDAKGVVGCISGTCHALWKLAVPGLVGLPAVANNRVFVQFGSPQSHADAYDLRGQTNCSGATLPLTCTPLWTHDLGVSVPVTASTTAANDVVFFERYTGTSNEIPDGDLYVEALDQSTGALRFSTPPNHGFMPPVVGDGRLYLSGNDGVEVFSLP